MEREALTGKSKSIPHFAWEAHPCIKQHGVARLYANDVPDSLFLLSWAEMMAEHRLHALTWRCQRLSRTCSRDPPSTNLTDIWIAAVGIRNINDVFWEGGVKDGDVGVSRQLLAFIRRDHSGSVPLWSLRGSDDGCHVSWFFPRLKTLRGARRKEGAIPRDNGEARNHHCPLYVRAVWRWKVLFQIKLTMREVLGLRTMNTCFWSYTTHKDASEKRGGQSRQGK